MADDQSTAATSGNQGALLIPVDIKQNFPDLLELILRSESMNDEERQYWIDILPVMTPDQITQLETILHNEKTQLAAIDAKYAGEMKNLDNPVSIEQMTLERQKANAERSSKEQAARAEDHKQADDLLNEME